MKILNEDMVDTIIHAATGLGDDIRIFEINFLGKADTSDGYNGEDVYLQNVKVYAVYKGMTEAIFNFELGKRYFMRGNKQGAVCGVIIKGYTHVLVPLNEELLKQFFVMVLTGELDPTDAACFVTCKANEEVKDSDRD